MLFDFCGAYFLAGDARLKAIFDLTSFNVIGR